MLFNSIEFAIYLPLVFLLYWFGTQKSLRAQNLLLVAASYVFYGWWDWRFLSLIVFSSCVDYIAGIRISKAQSAAIKKRYLLLSILVNLGFLGFFKYFNFFAESFADAFTFFGQETDPILLNIILPVGISFYTFQTLSYTIDVYRGKVSFMRDPVAFFAYVSFFPQLVAGPIERAGNLLPQFAKKREFKYSDAADGMRQMLWGFFKKIVIADNCAIFANEIFANYQDYSGSTLFLGAVFFAFQIYGDFSGYSDIAIGTARLFGFRLMKNFAYPYFSRDIAEFWRRWHISLSTWFRDYVYIPLGGSKGSNTVRIRNVFIIFLVSGFWHGANWTFVIWGFLNAVYFLPLMLSSKNRVHTGPIAEGRLLPSIRETWQIATTFVLTTFAWIFFRAPDVTTAFDYIGEIFNRSLLTIPELITPKTNMIYTLLCAGILFVFEWLQREKEHGLEIAHLKKVQRWTLYIGITVLIMTFGAFGKTEFIYFQF